MFNGIPWQTMYYMNDEWLSRTNGLF